MKRKRGNAKPKPKKPSLAAASEAVSQFVGLNANYSLEDLLCEYDVTMETETAQDEPIMNDNEANLEQQIAASNRSKDKVNSVRNINTAHLGNVSKFAAKMPTMSSRGADAYVEYGSRMESELPLAQTSMSGHQTDPKNRGAAVKEVMGFGRNELREMIKSIIVDISKETGSLIARSSSGIANNPVINTPVVNPRGERTLEELAADQNPQFKEQELKASLSVIKKIIKLDAAKAFSVPVDPIALGIPDYFYVIETPMDFGTICHNLENGCKYMNSEDVYKDVQLIWKNCTKYNKTGNYILELMKWLKTNFNKYWTAAGLHTERDQTTDESTMMVSVHRKGRSVRHVPDKMGSSHVLGHHSSSVYKKAYQPHLNSKEPNSSLRPADVDASTSNEPNIRCSMDRRDHSVVPLFDKTRPSPAQSYHPSAIENRPQLSSNQPQHSQQQTEVNTSNIGHSQRGTHLQKRRGGVTTDSAGTNQIQFHEISTMDKQPHRSSNHTPSQVDLDTSEPNMRCSMNRSDHSVPVSDKTRPSQAQFHHPSAIDSQPQLSASNQQQPSQQQTEVNTNNIGHSQRRTRLQKRKGGVIADSAGPSQIQFHEISTMDKQPHRSSNHAPSQVDLDTSEPNMRCSMNRSDHLVPGSDKTRPSQAQFHHPSAIDSQPQLRASNQQQPSQQQTEVNTSNIGHSQCRTRLQKRKGGVIADSAGPNQIQFHEISTMDKQPHRSSNHTPSQVDLETSVVGRGSSLSRRSKGMLSKGDDRSTDTIAAGTPVPPTTVPQRTAPGLADDHATPANTVATPSATPLTPLNGTVDLSPLHVDVTGDGPDGNNGFDNEPLTPIEDVPSISATATGRVADVKCDCHGKIKLTISEDGKHFLGSTAPARSYRKLVCDHSTNFWPKWSLVDKSVKESWWQEFQGAFCLPDYPFHVVRVTWEKIGAQLYSGAIYDAHRHWKRTGRKKGWMREDVFLKFIELWTDEEFKKKSEQASRNRGSNAPGVGRHTGGSIPLAEHLARMKRVRGEINPALAFSITHRKKGEKPNEFGPWVNEKSKQIYTQYVSLVGSSQPANSDLSANSQSEPRVETLLETPPDKVPWSGKHWDEAAGGVKRGGRIYGFGENVSILDVGADPNATTHVSKLSKYASSTQTMTRDDAVRIMQENPIFSEIIADTLAGKVSETVGMVGETVVEKVSETVVEKVSETIDGKLIDLVRQIGAVMGGSSTTTEMLLNALRRGQAEHGTSS